MTFKNFTSSEAISKGFRENADKQSGQHSVILKDSEGNYKPSSSFDISEYDFIALTYVAAGNGVGEIETAIYKLGGSGGSTVATLTLGYDANDNLSSVTKS